MTELPPQYKVVKDRDRIGGMFTAGDRPKSKSPIRLRLYEDQQRKLEIEAKEKGISIAQLILEKLDSIA